MGENKKKKSLLPLLGLGALLLLSKKSNNNATNYTDLNRALAQKKQNYAYEVILSDGGGNEEIEKMIKQDFIIGENDLPQYNSNQIAFYPMPDSVKVEIKQFTKDVALDKRFYTTSAYVTSRMDYSNSFWNQFYLKPFDYYLKISCIVIMNIPKSGYDNVSIDKFLIGNILLQYKNQSSTTSYFPIFLNYLKNNDYQEFWTPQEFNSKNNAGDILVTNQFENTIKRNQYQFKPGLNFLHLEFILPQKYYYKSNGAEQAPAYNIYMANQGKNTADYNAISFLQLLRFRFDIEFEIKKFDNTDRQIRTIQFDNETFYNAKDNGRSIFADGISTGGGGQATTDTIVIDPDPEHRRISAKQSSSCMSVNNQNDEYKDFGYIIGRYDDL